MPISDQLKEFLSKYDSFELISGTDKNYPLELEGVLDVKGKQDEIYDRFHISITIPEEYPKSLPKVKELDKRIPRVADRHINPDNSCCLCLPIAEDIFIDNGFNLVEFYESLVIPFFANQIYFEKTGSWAVGEFAHGTRGMFQFYEEAFRTDNHSIIIYGLRIAIGYNSPPFDFMSCFCGSKLPYSSCHKMAVEIFKMIGEEIILNDIKKLSA